VDWELLSMIGTIAFAVSGAVVAMEEEYDILGVYVLGLVTAFGGGVVRNLLIGYPVSSLWNQGDYFRVAIVAMTIVFILPTGWIKKYKTPEVLLDAIGLSAFAIQGALYAVNMERPLSAVIVAAMMTGIGGGIVRDVLAKRKPLVLRDEIYAVWAMLGGLCLGLGWKQNAISLFALFALIVLMRMLSIYYKWKLPRRVIHIAAPKVYVKEGNPNDR
jgi:uncharacterized membrane protein YeiH